MAKRRGRKPKLTKEQIDFYLNVAATTIKEVERQLELSFGIPHGLIGLRIRGQV